MFGVGSRCPDCGGFNQKPDGSFECPAPCPASGEHVVTYPLADSLRLGEKFSGCVLTGEFRAPRKGEWYLSGAIPAGYRAPNDLSTPYHIVQPA